jgi:hypothetical protein
LLVSDAIVAVIALVADASRHPAQSEKGNPMKHAAEKPAAGSAPEQGNGSKKEL